MFEGVGLIYLDLPSTDHDSPYTQYFGVKGYHHGIL